MDSTDPSRSVPLLVPGPSLLMLPTGEWGTIRAFMLIFIWYTSAVSVYTSCGDLGTIFFVVSSLIVHGTMWFWFENLSWNAWYPGHRSATLLASGTEGDSHWRPRAGGYQIGSSRLASISMLLLASVCSCLIIYSTVRGYYRAIGGAPTELFAACYVGVAVIYHYQHLIVLVVGMEAPMLLPTKTLLELVIWTTATTLAMWVSSGSITLYPSHPGVLASDAGAFCVLILMSGRFLQAGEGNIFSNCAVYHALLFSFIIRTGLISSSSIELIAAMILYGFINVVTLWDVLQAGETTSNTRSVAMLEPDL